MPKGTPRKNKWKDFSDNGLGPSLPLSNQQQKIPASGLLPSGESNFFDPSQYHSLRFEHAGAQGSGINFPFPYPNNQTVSTAPQYAFLSGEKIDANKFTDNWWNTSGIIKTYPPSDGALVDSVRQSGILHYNSDGENTSGIFSNGEAVKSKQIEDFKIFNTYIHHQLMPSTSDNGEAIKIPYVSTYRKSINWIPYG